MGSHLFSLARMDASQRLIGPTNVVPYQWACACAPTLGREVGLGRKTLGGWYPSQFTLTLLSGCPSSHIHEAIMDGVLSGEMTFLEALLAPERANAPGYGHHQLKRLPVERLFHGCFWELQPPWDFNSEGSQKRLGEHEPCKNFSLHT